MPPYPTGQQQPPYPGGPYQGGPYQGGPYPPYAGGQPGWGQVLPRPPRVVAAPAGEPYHRLGRNVFHRWWRPLVGTLFLGAAALAATIAVVMAWSIAHALITGDIPEPQGNEIFPSATENLAATLVVLGVLTPVVLLTAWFIQRRPLLSVASVLNRIRWRWLLISCLPGVGYLALSFGLGAALEELFPSADPAPADDGSWVGFARFILPAVLILLLVPFQSAAEEFVFRGWLVQAIGSYSIDGEGGNVAIRLLRTVLRTPWPALVISSAVFVGAHGYTGWAMADIFLFAMTVGWITIRTGGLEAAITLHTLNNLTVFLLSAATGQLDSWADQGGAPWTLLAADIPCLAFYAFSVVWLAKRNEVARFSQPVS